MIEEVHIHVHVNLCNYTVCVSIEHVIHIHFPRWVNDKTCTASLLQPTLGSYVLTPTVVNAVTDKGSPITLSQVDVPGPSEAGPPSQAASPSQPYPTARILYLLDRYRVSDEFYNEMAQVNTEIHKTHVY